MLCGCLCYDFNGDTFGGKLKGFDFAEFLLLPPILQFLNCTGKCTARQMQVKRYGLTYQDTQ
ncbi:hypothetical protein MBAV_005130 [Candidatus Magnetobacterium bavaricum]|uniref:Uncharacterized protein n=1 Tax=Candidatus Magnetobacterium bavaricum TaxID=29290 RepID=A0A0F3GLB0_9BACT|nr:hypothetical protein MBAV_005130 [Candidatus Magnetobacterium bavaricum]